MSVSASTSSSIWGTAPAPTSSPLTTSSCILKKKDVLVKPLSTKSSTVTSTVTSCLLNTKGSAPQRKSILFESFIKVERGIKFDETITLELIIKRNPSDLVSLEIKQLKNEDQMFFAVKY